jgi:hypothetical protein
MLDNTVIWGHGVYDFNLEVSCLILNPFVISSLKMFGGPGISPSNPFFFSHPSRQCGIYRRSICCVVQHAWRVEARQAASSLAYGWVQVSVSKSGQLLLAWPPPNLACPCTPCNMHMLCLHVSLLFTFFDQLVGILFLLQWLITFFQ